MKGAYFCFFLFISLLLAVPCAQAQLLPVINDDFAQPNARWPIIEGRTKSTSFSSGSYELTAGQASGVVVIPESNYGLREADFQLQADLSLVEPNMGISYGLIFNATDQNNAYALLLSAGRQYALVKYTDGKQDYVRNWRLAANIKPSDDVNKLIIQRKGSTYTFIINNETLYTSSNIPFLGNKSGLYLFGPATMATHYYKLQQEKKLKQAHLFDGEVEKENLGQMVNSTAEELTPLISYDGKRLWFSRMKHSGNQAPIDKADVWLATTTAKGVNWQQAKNVGAPINNQSHNFVISESPDGQSVLVANQYNTEGETVGGGVSISHKTGTGWSLPKPIQIDDYMNLQVNAGYCLSPNQNVLIMSVERPEGLGDLDLFYSLLKPNGTWSSPVSLGSKINTPLQELTPFLAIDNRTLYFSSNGHPGYGSADIFVSRRIGNGWEEWTEPLNLGEQINSTNWDGYFSIPATGDYAYIVSRVNTLGGNDIFRLRVKEPEPEEETTERPDPVVVINGKITDADTGRPLPANLYYTDAQTGEEIGLANANALTGEFKIILPYGSRYSFRAESEKHLAVSAEIDLRQPGEYKEVERNLALPPVVLGKSIRLNNVHFKKGTYDLFPDSYEELNNVAKLMRDNPRMKIKLEGHTDNVGNPLALMRLSKQRVGAVRNYLVAQGIPYNRIEGEGFGRMKPLTDNNTEEEREKNRRVEFIITEI